MTLPTRTSFQDVRDEILRRIRDRIWPQGSLLPSEVELAEEFGCARATVNRALRELSDQGIVDRKRKSGTRVTTTPARHAKFEIPVVRREIEAVGGRYRYALLERTEMAAPDWLAARLSLADRAPILHLKCLHFSDNTPFQYEERWVSVEAVPTILDADLSQTGPNEWLLLEVPFTEAEISFGALAADQDIADVLSLTVSTPLFRMERTTWLGGKPVTFVKMTFCPGYRMTSHY